MTAPVASGPTGVLLPTVLIPGSPEWLRNMSASKIAAVVGLSPYESRFSLWHRMAGLLPQEDDGQAHLRRGHYLEPGVAAWYADQHPDLELRPGGSWAHRDEPRFTASPDRLAVQPDGTFIGVELKTAADDDEWGPAGTDQIPAGYRAQIQWQMDVVGTRVTHLAVLSAYLEFREYVITYDPDDAAFLRAQAAAFLDSLPDGPAPQRPHIDSHGATYEAVRQLHPEIEDRKHEVTTDTALRYLTAYQAHRDATAELQTAKALLLDEIGTARRAIHADRQIAMRTPARGGSVALKHTAS